jgi:hypothetical protein
MGLRNSEKHYSHYRHMPITLPAEELPYETQGEPTFKVGDLVQFKRSIQRDILTGRRPSPWMRRKKAALVRKVRWTLCDHETRWEDGDNPVSPYYVPECVLYWNDGDTTSTSQNCLEIMEK